MNGSSIRRSKLRLTAVAAGALSLLLAGQAPAANVAYINASGGSVSYLTGFGHTVTNINNPIGLTLGSLAGFDAVLVASNSIFSQPANIGNVLADFADAGGGVVLTQFVFQGQWALGGKIMTPTYSPLTIDPLSSGYNITSNLGVILDPGSPLFTGVNTANVFTNFQANSLLNPGATLVASWTTGRPAFAYRGLAGSTIVALNLFPDGSWTTNADTRRVVSNAINMSLDPVTQAIPEPASIALLGMGALALGYAGRRRRQKQTV